MMTAPQPMRLSTQLWRYVVTGLVNTGIGLAVIFALRLGAGVDLVVSNAVGYAVGWLISYGLNRNWTFGHSGRMRRSLPAYLVLVLAAFGANIAIISTLTAHGLAYVPAQIVGAGFYSIAVFIGAKYVVFLHRD